MTSILLVISKFPGVHCVCSFAHWCKVSVIKSNGRFDSDLLSLAELGGECLLWHFQCTVQPLDHAGEKPGLLSLTFFFKKWPKCFPGFIHGDREAPAFSFSPTVSDAALRTQLPRYLEQLMGAAGRFSGEQSAQGRAPAGPTRASELVHTLLPPSPMGRIQHC